MKKYISFIFCSLFLVINACQEITGRKMNDNRNSAKQEKELLVKDTILIVTMAFNERHLLEDIKTKVGAFYNSEIKEISAELPKEAYLPARNRYRANELLRYLKALNNGRYSFVAGLTSKDISTTKDKIDDWGIFGLGTMDAGACVSSTFRLKRKASGKLLLERLQKVILHEIGHNHGLPHCTTSLPCFMKDAEGKISTVDNEPMDVCRDCRTKMTL